MKLTDLIVYIGYSIALLVFIPAYILLAEEDFYKQVFFISTGLIIGLTPAFFAIGNYFHYSKTKEWLAKITFWIFILIYLSYHTHHSYYYGFRGIAVIQEAQQKSTK